MRIIVNADDLGMSEDVNEAIFQGMSNGRITSATALSNAPATKAAAKESQFFSRCSFGVHLNLTEFEPLSENSAGLAKILNGSRCFNGNAIREVKIDALFLAAVYREWCSQIENLTRLGFTLSHLDSHHHVHTIPELLPVLAAIRRRYNICKIRISRNLYENRERPSSLLLQGKKLFNFALRVLGFRTTRTFADFSTFIHLHSQHAIPCDSVELMTGSCLTRDETQLLQGSWRSGLGYKFIATRNCSKRFKRRQTPAKRSAHSHDCEDSRVSEALVQLSHPSV
ncbi:MAG: hypothetical protein C5B58_03360 [Acidobacteria bacterium]|nr:MAG: hypothetical protein C5B58_03360 [Acidobacteriota bacterium]